MENSDVIKIVEAIGGVHADLKEDIGNLKMEFARFQGNTTARIEAVETDIKDTKKYQWIHTAVVVPVLGVLHGIANHFGIHV
jgi:hypothetical protein